MGCTVTLDEQNLEDGVTRAHVFRYLAARGVVEPDDVVIDAASGCGAGSEILARSCKQVIGIDFDEDNIQHAVNEHVKDKPTKFVTADLDEVGLPECDVIISIETLEHVTNPERVVAEFQRVAKRAIFVTVPIGKTTDTDPTHKTDFMNENEFKNLFKDPNWMEYHSFWQGDHLGVIYRRKEVKPVEVVNIRQTIYETQTSQQNPRW